MEPGTIATPMCPGITLPTGMQGVCVSLEMERLILVCGVYFGNKFSAHTSHMESPETFSTAVLYGVIPEEKSQVVV